jgi:hypothetical protein
MEVALLPSNNSPDMHPQHLGKLILSFSKLEPQGLDSGGSPRALLH